MNITVDFEVAEKIIDLINEKKYIDDATYEDEMSKIEKLEGMQKMLNYYKGSFDFSTYKELLFKALNNFEYVSEDESLNAVYTYLKKVIEDTERLNNKLRLMRDYDFNKFEKKLVEKLPKNTNVDVDIFFAFDALNGGTIINDKTMMLNTMFWPSKEENLKLIEGILLHEYHHIGFFYWMRKFDRDFDKYSDANGMVRYLIISILGEGAATYFYNDGDDMYPLVLESHGEALAESTRSAMGNRGNNVAEYIRDLEKDIRYIMSSEDDIKELKSFVNKYFYSSNGEPLDKSIGYHMCETIDQELGLEKLIECFEKPNIFLNRYNHASGKNSEFKVAEDIVEFFQ
ncbi:MAG: hypothetical protein JEZ08_05195 [Clostridiales bacterium]|nr:hypothetical protein [Clostridiales bacterium]